MFHLIIYVELFYGKIMTRSYSLFYTNCDHLYLFLWAAISKDFSV